MDWILLVAVAVLWLVSPIILLIALIVTRYRLKEARQRLGNQPSGEQGTPVSIDRSNPSPSVVGEGWPMAAADLENLLLLRLELLRLGQAEVLAEARWRYLSDALDQVWARHLRETGNWPESALWQRRRAEAWNALAQELDEPLGPPPWQAVEPIPASAVSELAPLITESVPVGAPVSIPAPEQPLPPTTPIPAISYKSGEEDELVTSHPSVMISTEDWRPTAPNPLEKALRSLSSWPKLIAPFLMQNIGWFVGGFCFVAGALFLIANTQGYANALVVFASLFGATAFLLWAGYRFRDQGNDLVVASSVLLTLAMLLAPLDVAMAVRLTNASMGDGLLLALSVAITVATLAAYVWAATLVNALMDRALPRRYTHVLVGLVGMQLAAPLAVVVPDWPGLVLLQLILLALLGYGLWRFASTWLQRLFVDRWLTTYYAAGVLVYTAVVSFAHLSWIWPESPPDGHAGPLLMILCGLLFTVDAALKEWVHKYTFLSRFSFVLYALSVVAIVVATRSTPATLLTLALGAMLYGWITWRYRTLPPLYLLLGCLAGLYGFGMAAYLPPVWHGLASMPGLVALLAMGRWAGSRSRAIALQCLIVFGAVLIGVLLWSLLFWPRPGMAGFVTATAAALLAYRAIRLALLLPAADPRWAYTDAFVVALAGLAVIYTPKWTPFAWETESALGLLVLAASWIGLGAHDRRQSERSRSVFMSGALANVILALALGIWRMWLEPSGWLELVLLLMVAGGLLFWMSLRLRRQMLIYGVLACIGGIAVLIKQGYFPAPSNGLGPLLGIFPLWSLLWWLAWRFPSDGLVLENDGKSGKGGEDSEGERSLSSSKESGKEAFAWVRVPLEQSMVLLWVIGVTQLGLRLLDGMVGFQWAGATGLAGLGGLLLVAYFHAFRWTVLPILLGLSGLLVSLERIGLPWPWWVAVAVLSVLIIWQLAIALLDKPLIWRLARVLGFTVPGGAGGCRQIEESLYRGLMCVAVLPGVAGMVLGLLGIPILELSPALVLSVLAFVLVGWRYRLAGSVYAALSTVTIGVWLLGCWLEPVMPFGLGQPLSNGTLSLGLALAGLRLERKAIVSLKYWQEPLYRMGSLLYLLALMGAILGFWAADPQLPGLLVLLCIALFPVARPWPSAATWRGLGLALLLSALVWNGTRWMDLGSAMEATIAAGWGYVLWCTANLLLPRWNIRWPDWAIEPTLWPLLGLIAVLGAGGAATMSGDWPLAIAPLCLALYLLLLSRNTGWSGIGWLAVAALIASGLLIAGVPVWGEWMEGRELSAAIRWQLIVLVWLNGLFLLARWWPRYGRRVARRLGWQWLDLEAPLFWLPFAVLFVLLAQLLALEFAQIGAMEQGSWSLTGSALLLAVTAGHARTLRLEWESAHVLLIALGAVLLAVLIHWGVPLAGLPLALASWAMALLLVWRYGSRHGALWREALEIWLILLPVVAVALLLVVPGINGGLAAATLAILALVVLACGWWRQERRHLRFGLYLALAGGYALWWGAATVSWAALVGLTPWYALQTVLLLLGWMAIRRWVTIRIGKINPEVGPEWLDGWYELERATRGLIPGLFGLSGLWLGLHAYALIAYGLGWGPLPWRFGIPADSLATAVTLILLAGWAAFRAWREADQPNWIYVAMLPLALLAVYLRLLVLGLAPFAVADTVTLLAAAYVAFLLYSFMGSPPLYRLAVLFPLLALATVPWQFASVWTGGALLATAVLYLSLASRFAHPWPLYLGVLALNGAVYLWAPLWAEHYGLWQFYIVPAALSVLVLLHLHRRELRPKVLNGARLAALSALYAGAGLDVFLRPELSAFVLALALALTGIMVGIAWRIRAFLYAGLAFLVLNVIGQLVRFYPEQGLSRALILLGLGVAITVGMVMFNLKREAILRRVRIMHTDLVGWE